MEQSSVGDVLGNVSSMKSNKTDKCKPRPKKYAKHGTNKASLACFRSALTNGSALILGRNGKSLDARSAWARRLRDLVAAHVSDCGGADNLSEAERTLVKRSAMLTLQLEFMEASFAEQDGVATETQIASYQRVVNTLRRTLESVGLQRRARDVTPDPLTYAKHYADGVAA